MRAEGITPVDEFDIPELAEKVVASAKISRYSDKEQELSLEFTDGTSFSFACCTKLISEATAYRGGVGMPDDDSRVQGRRIALEFSSLTNAKIPRFRQAFQKAIYS